MKKHVNTCSDKNSRSSNTISYMTVYKGAKTRVSNGCLGSHNLVSPSLGCDGLGTHLEMNLFAVEVDDHDGAEALRILFVNHGLLR